MDIKTFDLEGIKLITPRCFPDERGFFLESYHKNRYQKNGLTQEFVQDNHSYSCRGTLRGMHFQVNPGQDKLVYVPFGKIYDVVVDIRPESKTYKKWMGLELDDEKHQQLFIPKGFAHGFYVLSEHAHVIYKVSEFYDAKTEKSLRWNDPAWNIKWPSEQVILSEKDAQAPFWSDIESLMYGKTPC